MYDLKAVIFTKHVCYTISVLYLQISKIIVDQTILPVLRVFQQDTSYPNVSYEAGEVLPTFLCKSSFHQNNAFHTDDGNQMLNNWVPSRPIGEFSLRKWERVDAYVKRFSTYQVKINEEC